MEYIAKTPNILSKQDIKNITQNISPEEARYVNDIRSTITDSNANSETADDVIFLAKLLAFKNKFYTNKLVDGNYNYKNVIGDFYWILHDYTDNMFQIIQSIIGEIQGADLAEVKLPVSDNPLELINEVKIMIQNFVNKHKEDNEYIGAVSKSSDFLATVHKYIYNFRLAKVSSNSYAEQISVPNPESPVIMF